MFWLINMDVYLLVMIILLIRNLDNRHFLIISYYLHKSFLLVS